MIPKDEFAQLCYELLQVVGPVSYKRMFGGVGYFIDGCMIAIIANGTLYFKVDTSTKARFEQAGLLPFTYDKKGKQVKMNFYEAPEEVFESNDEMRDWGNLAYTAARHAMLKKHRKKTKN